MLYDSCTPAWAPAFSYPVDNARTESEQRAIIERATATQSDAPASSDVQDETWFCGTTTRPTDADTAVQDADVACLTREAEDRLYHQRAAERAAERAERRGPVAFVVSILFIIILLGGAGTLAHALTKTAGSLTTPATAITGEEAMATRIPAQKTKATATPAPEQVQPKAPTTPAPEQVQPKAPTTPAPAPAPTLAQLLARALEARDSAPTPTTPAPAPEQAQPITLTTALKRALMAPRTGTTECVIYSTLYAAIRVEEVTTPAPAETPKADEQATSVWTIASDTRRVVFLRELRNVSRGRAYCEQITALLGAIDATDDDYVWHTATFGSLPEDLQKAIKDQFESDACTDDERAECRDALDPHSERITLHRTAIETACERLARIAPEWAPLLYEAAPAPATLRQAILEFQYCIFPIDSSPRARVFRGLEGIDFRALSTPQDYQAACRAASLRAGEPSTAIPPEARARILQWRSGSVTSTSPTAVTSTAARLAAVWGMD